VWLRRDCGRHLTAIVMGPLGVQSVLRGLMDVPGTGTGNLISDAHYSFGTFEAFYISKKKVTVLCSQVVCISLFVIVWVKIFKIFYPPFSKLRPFS